MTIQRCEALIARDKNVIAPCQHLSYFPLVVEDCKGSILTDADGNQFIDFLSSASSLNLGSSHPVITQAIQAQLEKFTQYTQAYCYNQQSIEYAERLFSVYPGGVSAKVCFGNCGSDGNDAAIKFARAYTGRQKIIVFVNGYHGSTYGAATLTTCSTRVHEKMGPFLPEVYAFPFFGTDQDSETVKLIAQAIEKAGHTPHTALGGGGSDANVYNLKGIETVVLGTGMTKVHTTDECLKIQDLNDTARVILALLSL